MEAHIVSTLCDLGTLKAWLQQASGGARSSGSVAGAAVQGGAGSRDASLGGSLGGGSGGGVPAAADRVAAGMPHAEAAAQAIDAQLPAGPLQGVVVAAATTAHGVTPAPSHRPPLPAPVVRPIASTRITSDALALLRQASSDISGGIGVAAALVVPPGLASEDDDSDDLGLHLPAAVPGLGASTAAPRPMVSVPRAMAIVPPSFALRGGPTSAGSAYAPTLGGGGHSLRVPLAPSALSALQAARESAQQYEEDVDTEDGEDVAESPTSPPPPPLEPVVLDPPPPLTLPKLASTSASAAVARADDSNGVGAVGAGVAGGSSGQQVSADCEDAGSDSFVSFSPPTPKLVAQQQQQQQPSLLPVAVPEPAPSVYPPLACMPPHPSNGQRVHPHFIAHLVAVLDTLLEIVDVLR